MKKILFSMVTVAFLIACNSNPKTDTTTTTTIPAIINTDSINRVQADKNQAVQMNGVNDTIIGSDGQMYIKAKQGTQPTVLPTPPARVTPARSVVRHQHSTPRRTTNNNNNQGSGTGSGSTVNTGNGTGTSSSSGTTTTTQSEVPKKKGWSNAAKGTAIGAASGAVAGAIISKNKGVGAVVGGLIGAGGGYIIGRKKDKKRQQADSTSN